MVAEKEETKTHSESFFGSIKECSTSWGDNFQPRHNKCASKPACSSQQEMEKKSNKKYLERLNILGGLRKKTEEGQENC